MAMAEIGTNSQPMEYEIERAHPQGWEKETATKPFVVHGNNGPIGQSPGEAARAKTGS